MVEVVIVGAGVIGLSSALALVETSNVKVIIVAEHTPESMPYSAEYTSPWAGAHFRPYPSTEAHQLKEYPLARATYKRFMKMARENPESSIRFVDGVEYLEAKNPWYEELREGFKEGLEEFRVIPKKELPSGFALGFSYKTFVLDAPHYLRFLYRKLRFHYGVKFVTCRLSNLEDALTIAPDAKIVVNCSGTGLQWDGSYDASCFPVRGQTILVNARDCGLDTNKTVTIQHANGDWTFSIPRPLDGGIILGGTKQPHDTYPGVRESDVEAVVDRAHRFLGAGNLHIERVNVGFRPARNGGINLLIDKKNRVPIVNAYGTGGSGFEFSYGIGLRVAKMVSTPFPKL